VLSERYGVGSIEVTGSPGYIATRDNHHYRFIQPLEFRRTGGPNFIDILDGFGRKREVRSQDVRGSAPEAGPGIARTNGLGSSRDHFPWPERVAGIAACQLASGRSYDPQLTRGMCHRSQEPRDGSLESSLKFF